MAQNILTYQDLSVFCSSISLLLHAGMTSRDACEVFAKDSDTPASRTAEEISSFMMDGIGFAESAEKSGAFPEYALNVLRISEYSGKTEEGLERLASYYDRQYNRRLRMRSAVSYPAGLLLMMCAVLAVLVFTVLPMFSRVYGSLTGSLAASSYAYVLISGVIARVGLALAAAVCLALLGAFVASGSEKGRKALRALLDKLPAAGKTMENLALADFADTLSTLISGGMDMDSAMEMTITYMNHAGLAAKLGFCREDMERGSGLAESMFRRGVFSAIYGRMLVSGEAAGNLETALMELAERVNRDSEVRIEEMLDSVEPILIAFLAVTVGLTLLSVMLPLLGVLGAL